MVAWDGLNILVLLNVPKKILRFAKPQKTHFLRFLRVFGHFLEFGSLVFAEIAYDGSLGWSQHINIAKCAEKNIAARQTAKTAFFCGF